MQTETSPKAGERTHVWSVNRGRADWLLYRKNSLIFGLSRNEIQRGGWAARLNFFGGAGIHFQGSRIRGLTLFCAFKSGSRRWVNRHRAGLNPWTGRRYSLLTKLTNFEFGITRNASAVPYTSH